jgi:hypothetical protein
MVQPVKVGQLGLEIVQAKPIEKLHGALMGLPFTSKNEKLTFHGRGGYHLK